MNPNPELRAAIAAEVAAAMADEVMTADEAAAACGLSAEWVRSLAPSEIPAPAEDV